MADILQMVYRPTASFGRQEAQRHYELALTCTRFANLLRWPLPAYASLTVDAVDFNRQGDDQTASGALAPTSLQSLSWWLQTGRCLAVRHLTLNNLQADWTQPVLGLVAVGLKSLEMLVCNTSHAQRCLELTLGFCTALTFLEVNSAKRFTLMDGPINLAPLSALSSLQVLRLPYCALNGLDGSVCQLLNLTRLALGPVYQSSLPGLTHLSKLQDLCLMLSVRDTAAIHISFLSSLVHLSKLALGGHHSVCSLDLGMMTCLQHILLYSMEALNYIKSGSRLLETVRLHGTTDKHCKNAMKGLLNNILQLQASLSNLRRVQMMNMALDTIPIHILQCKLLERLECSSCSLHEWPSSLALLPSLRRLSILSNRCDLEVLPQHVASLQKLTLLSLSTFGPCHLLFPQGLGHLQAAGAAITQLDMHSDEVDDLNVMRSIFDARVGYTAAHAQ